VTRWVLEQRPAFAQRVLKISDQSIDHVAESAGFGSAASLRQHFAAAFGTTPTAWRRQLRGEAPTLLALDSSPGARARRTGPRLRRVE
jgi:transcriptional regulator GlxA family with amidase domain